MRTINSKREIKVPEGVEIVVKSRQVTVKGPRGELFKDFRHLRLDIKLYDHADSEGATSKRVLVEKWFGKTKQLASLRTVTAHIENMFTGVLKGFRYFMRSVYAHFPINVAIEDNGKKVEIRNFLGEKRTRVIKMLEGVTATRDPGVKDQFIFEGNDIELVSRSCSLIHQACLVRKKDIRKFLDGMYISEKGAISDE